MIISSNKMLERVAIFAVLITLALRCYGDHKYVPIIRYDRVWECTSSDDFHTYTVKYMKFDGTEEINGKIYHRIVTFRKSIMEKKYDSVLDTYEYTDGICQLEGYLREDNGKVYTLASGVYDYDGVWYGCLYPLDHPNNEDSIEEFLIYDFNCESGQRYEALSNRTRSNELANFTVISKSTVPIDNEECLLLKVEIEGFSPSFQIIEGIGPILFGCLNYQEHAFPTMMWEYNYFNRVFDNNGKVLYERPDAYDYKLPDNIFSSVDIINDSGQLRFNGEVLTFGSDYDHNSVTILNADGSIVKRISNDCKLSISTIDMASGIYIVSAQAGNATPVLKKIIIR